MLLIPREGFRHCCVAVYYQSLNTNTTFRIANSTYNVLLEFLKFRLSLKTTLETLLNFLLYRVGHLSLRFPQVGRSCLGNLLIESLFESNKQLGLKTVQKDYFSRIGTVFLVEITVCSASSRSDEEFFLFGLKAVSGYKDDDKKPKSALKTRSQCEMLLRVLYCQDFNRTIKSEHYFDSKGRGRSFKVST